MARSNSRSLTSFAGLAEGVPWGWVTLSAVLCVGAWRDAVLLTQYPIAVGVDGYYYVLQAETLWAQHHLFFPSGHPLMFYVLAGVRYVTGDSVTAVKVVAVSLHLALCGGVFALVRAVTRSLWLGVLGSALATASSLHLYFVVEFINNLGAVALLTWGSWAAVRFSQTRRRLYGFAAFICVTAAALSHRSALPIALILAVLVFLSRGLGQGVRFARKGRLVILLIVASWLIPAVSGAVWFHRLPAWLQLEISTVPRWPWGRHSAAEAVILLLAAPATLVLLSRCASERRRLCWCAVGVIAFLTLTFTLNPFIKSAEVWGGTAERLRGLSYVQAAILVPCVIRMLRPERHKVVPYLLALLLPLIVLSNRAPLPPGLEPEYMRHRTQMIGHLRELSAQFAPSTFVVAPHGDQFVVTATTGIPSQQRMPSQTEGRTVYWLVRRLRCDESMLAALVLTEDGGRLCTMLIEDGELRRKSKLLSNLDKQSILAANPHVREVPGLIY